ncbi:MAG: RNA-binding protein [Gammaproteobacteria bacterium]|nr:MAG: RNA-binding protein [Gammaproteobacteria bacterium]
MDRLRIDKWLWAARFFKTRPLASQAVSGGKVHLNGERVKPAKMVKPGDMLNISKGNEEFIIQVLGIASKRGPAKFAQTLYEETIDSLTARQLQREARRLKDIDSPSPDRRPDKRQRRMIRKLTRH